MLSLSAVWRAAHSSPFTALRMASRCSSNRTSMITLNSDSLVDLSEHFFFLETGSQQPKLNLNSLCSQGWLELLTSPTENSDIGILQSTQFCEVLGVEARALCMLAKCSTNGATSQPSRYVVTCFLTNNSRSYLSVLFFKNPLQTTEIWLVCLFQGHR